MRISRVYSQDLGMGGGEEVEACFAYGESGPAKWPRGKLDADFAYWERDQMQSEGGDLDADFACGESGREFAKKVQNGGF